MCNTLVCFGIWRTDCNPIAIGSALAGRVNVLDGDSSYIIFQGDTVNKYWWSSKQLDSLSKLNY